MTLAFRVPCAHLDQGSAFENHHLLPGCQPVRQAVRLRLTKQHRANHLGSSGGLGASSPGGER